MVRSTLAKHRSLALSQQIVTPGILSSSRCCIVASLWKLCYIGSSYEIDFETFRHVKDFTLRIASLDVTFGPNIKSQLLH